MNSFSALSDPNDPIDPTDVEFFKFTSLVPDARVSIQKGSFDAPNYRASVSLIACSSKFGYFITATIEGFIFSSTKVLRKTFYDAEKSSTVQFEGDKILVSLSKPIHQLRISGDEKQILIATEGSELLVYNVDDIKNNKTEVKPVHAFNLTDEILDLRPNPEALPELAAVLFGNNCCKIINITNGDTVCELPINNISAICWSPKGKQIVCGKLDGTLQHFDTKGDSKDALPIPEAMSAGHGEETENRYVQDILWVENHYFLVMYARKRMNEEDDYINDGYIINRKPKSGTDPNYIRLAEITPIFTTEGRGNHFYMEIIRGLGKEIKHLIIIANAASSDISVVGEDENGEWSTWQLPENGLANLPLTEESAMDTFPVGLALDLSADEKLPPIDPSENDTPVEPFPIFYYLNDEGRIGAYHCYNTELARRGESYKSTIDSSSSTAPPTASAPVNTESTALSTPAASSTPMPSAFGVSTNSANNNSFADLLSGKNAAPATSAPSSKPTGFGFGAASGGGIPSFSSLGSAPKLSGGFASLSTQNSPSAPSFGSTSFGSSSFGSLNQPTTKITSPAFGSAISSNDEKKEQSTSEAKPMSSSAFGASPVKTEATTTTSPAFGSTSTLGSGGFGALAKNTIPGAKSPSSAPAFGSTSTLGGGAFGSPAKSTAPAMSTAPAFGSTSTLGSGGFGSLAKNTVPGAKAPTFGSASTLGSGTGFGKAPVTSASTTTPATTSTTSTAAPSITVASKTSVDTPPAAVTTPTSTTKPTVASSLLPKETTPSATTTAPTESVENIKPTAKEGMAKEYENLYITVTKDIDRLKKYHEKVMVSMKANSLSLESKSEDKLKDTSISWNLNDVTQLGNVAEELVKKISEGQLETQKLKEDVDIAVENCKKAMDKKEDIKHLLKTEFDPVIVDIMDNRELDVETKTGLVLLETKSEACDNILENLELKLQDKKRRNKLRNDHLEGQLSLYSLHRSIRDIEREMDHKNSDISGLEEKLAEVRLDDSRRKAKQTSRGFSCENLSDSEDEEVNSIDAQTIENTTRYIRRYNFLDVICNQTSKRTPIQTAVAE